MLIDRNNSVLLVVDVQDKLLSLTRDWQRVLDNCRWLVQVAQRLSVPVMATEQYPKGLGHTHEDLLSLLPEGAVGEKLAFSCAAAGCLPDLPGGERHQVVICGMEAHVCVLQTALELRWQGRQVLVVADAVTSRSDPDKELALKRMAAHGVEIVTREMVAFEWLRKSGTPEFKDISLNFLR